MNKLYTEKKETDSDKSRNKKANARPKRETIIFIKQFARMYNQNTIDC